jgi:hypothetical protein
LKKEYGLGICTFFEAFGSGKNEDNPFKQRLLNDYKK